MAVTMGKDDKTGYVYFMSNVSRMIYIGVTGDLDQRVGQHKTGFCPGYASKYKMDRLVYVETFPDMPIALARETQLKNWSRVKKVALIRERNPEWLDLARSA
jgi:putative endonuclease